jgi:hypothetical protein
VSPSARPASVAAAIARSVPAGGDQPCQPPPLGEQPVAVLAQYLQRVRLLGQRQHLDDPVQRQAEVAQQQDPLQSQQLLAFVPAPTIGVRPGRPEQADRVAMCAT